MNKRGSILIYTMMIGTLVILLALWLAPSIQDFTDDARTNMDCTNSSISKYDKATCIVVDLNLFYFAGALIFIGGVIVTAKMVIGE